MANHTGSEGVIHSGTNAVAEVRSWTLTETGDTIEDSIMGDSYRTYKAGMKTWTGSVVTFWDETDTNGQSTFTVGSSITIKFYAEGASTGDTYYYGSGLVTSVERSAAFDGMVEATYSFQGTGSLTTGTAA